jgi:hypothetical protein
MSLEKVNDTENIDFQLMTLVLLMTSQMAYQSPFFTEI